MATYLAYIDDSGDSRSFALGVILVPSDDRWLKFHDRLVTFRSNLSKDHGFRMAWELHATEMVGWRGKWRKTQTNQSTRNGIYKAALGVLSDSSELGVRSFGVVVPDNAEVSEPVERAWQLVLERFTAHTATTVILVPDDGNPLLIRKLVRRSRRHHYVPSMLENGPGTGLQRNFDRVVEDPLHRDSKLSYEVQWADLVAFASFRQLRPRARFPPDMWDMLDESLLRDVNRNNRIEQPGLVTWPRNSQPRP